jgi:hypothetical protein
MSTEGPGSREEENDKFSCEKQVFIQLSLLLRGATYFSFFSLSFGFGLLVSSRRRRWTRKEQGTENNKSLLAFPSPHQQLKPQKYINSVDWRRKRKRRKICEWQSRMRKIPSPVRSQTRRSVCCCQCQRFNSFIHHQLLGFRLREKRKASKLRIFNRCESEQNRKLF